MNRIELLAPAGDFESLQGAIANGANAIYLGTTAFSARAFAKNFSWLTCAFSSPAAVFNTLP